MQSTANLILDALLDDEGEDFKELYNQGSAADDYADRYMGEVLRGLPSHFFEKAGSWTASVGDYHIKLSHRRCRAGIGERLMVEVYRFADEGDPVRTTNARTQSWSEPSGYVTRDGLRVAVKMAFEAVLKEQVHRDRLAELSTFFDAALAQDQDLAAFVNSIGLEHEGHATAYSAMKDADVDYWYSVLERFGHYRQ